MTGTRDEFRGWIADRFIARHVPTLDRDEALNMAEAALSDTEYETGDFGDPRYGWGEDDAHDIADEEIHNGWEMVP